MKFVHPIYICMSACVSQCVKRINESGDRSSRSLFRSSMSYKTPMKMIQKALLIFCSFFLAFSLGASGDGGGVELVEEVPLHPKHEGLLVLTKWLLFSCEA